jgi:hypothetical protein
MRPARLEGKTMSQGAAIKKETVLLGRLLFIFVQVVKKLVFNTHFIK